VIAEVLAGLMTDVLGYQRFGAYGGDIGADVTNWLGIRYPASAVKQLRRHPALARPHRRRTLPAAGGTRLLVGELRSFFRPLLKAW
jgi:hypothetical protein